MQGSGIFFVFIGLLIIFAALGAGEGRSLVGTNTNEHATLQQNEEVTPVSETGESILIPEQTRETTETNMGYAEVPAPSRTRRLSNAEIERRLATIFRRIDRLEEQLESALLREPRSPYAGAVDLQIGNARNTDPEREYVTLRASSRNDVPINISDWYLQSVVTLESAAIPDGTRVPISVFTHKQSNVLLEPGEIAYVLSSESPINTSFHENICTGYLTDSHNFFPSLRRSCPDPEEEMKDFAQIDLDNDACFDFVERIRRCEVPDERDFEDAELSRGCEQFLVRELNYNACVENHSWEPLFDNIGSWRIYLERDDDLWRREREIIRLIDENDLVVDVVEY